MHYQSLTAALEQYSGNLTHNPASPNSLALHIDRQTQGRLKLHTPDGISLSLTCRDEPVFWSFHSQDLYDVYLVRSYAESWQAYQPVGHIGSRVNERIARQPAAEQGLLWNKYFIEQLAAQNAGLLGIGEWHFDYRPAQPLPPQWGECRHDTAVGQPKTDENYAQWLFSGSRFDALDNDFYTQTERFIALKTHHAEDGRLKYWRKRARQNQLPPILVYELTALSSRWLILDGHLRLTAALAEGQLPPLIVIQATTARPAHRCRTRNRADGHFVAIRKNRPTNRPQSPSPNRHQPTHHLRLRHTPLPAAHHPCRRRHRPENLAATTANLRRATRFRRRIRTHLDNRLMADETGSRISGCLKA